MAGQYPGVYVDEVPSGPRAIEGVATSITAFVGRARSGAVNTPVRIRSFADYAREFGGLWAESALSYAVQQFFENGGGEALIVRVAEPEPGRELTDADLVGERGDETGLYALEKVELFSLLCLPPPTRSGDVSLDTWSQAAAYCEERRAFLLIDPPSAWTDAAQVSDPAHGHEVDRLPASPNAAVYWPRLRMPDPLADDALADFAPSAAVAGQIARTDGTRGVWKAPAGLDTALAGVSGVALDVADAQSSLLSPLGVNCLRSMPPSGPVIWGARTRVGSDGGASTWKYIPVRRLALFLEESLDRGTQWAVFEPNDEALWAQIRTQVGAFLESLFRQGAFQGDTAEHAYFVQCGPETTTPDAIDRGVVQFQVGFAPIKPAEFVVLQIQQKAGQMDA